MLTDAALSDVKRGEQAEMLLNHPLFSEAVGSVRNGIVSALATSPMGDEKTHNRLAIALQLLNQIEKNLKDHIATAKMTHMQVNDKSRLRQVVGF